MQSDAMPTNEDTDSEEILEDPASRSVYDFLYQDVRRVGSFLAQFDEYGVRQSVKATESVGRAQTVRGAAAGTLGLPAVFGGTANIDVTTVDDSKDIAEHTFDPLWSNARRLLDYLASHSMLNDDIWNTHLGAFIKLEGNLAFIDPGLVKASIKTPFIKNIVRSNMIKDFKGSENEKNKLFDAFADLIQSFPTPAQAHLAGDNYTAWCNLSDASLSVPSADLALKHRSFIPGRWTLIGILDAFPDQVPEPSEENPSPKTMDEVVAEFAGTSVGTMTSQITALARTIVGRPRLFFGVTPLLIFREVAAS